MKHTSYHLELRSRDNFRPTCFPEPGGSFTLAVGGDSDRCAYLWKEVGKGFWNERSQWSGQAWTEYLQRDDVQFWILVSEDADAGFFELSKSEREVKIEGIGLLPSFRGKGYGGALLSIATQKAYEWDASRVWLHTATDDHPNALQNYLNRGYRIYHEEELKNPMQAGESTASEHS